MYKIIISIIFKKYKNILKTSQIFYYKISGYFVMLYLVLNIKMKYSFAQKQENSFLIIL